MKEEILHKSSLLSKKLLIKNRTMEKSESYLRAIELLRTAKNVDHWNEIRSTISPGLSPAEISAIDGSGLIVEVLGSDYMKAPR